MSTSLLEQFVSEARDLLEEIAQGLLALEDGPADAERVNAVFRAAHTIKGSSGLFEGAAPLTRVVHAAEDVLDAVRDGRLVLDPDLVDLLLEGFDQVNQWVDELEASGALSPDAAAVADALSGRLRGLLGQAGSAGEEEARTADAVPAGRRPAWVDRLPPGVCEGLLREAAEEGVPLVAVEYTPDENCFFRGDDPLLTVRNTPGRAWVGVEPAGEWPSPSVMDPFRCALRFRVLAKAEPGAVREHYRYVEDQVQVAVVPDEVGTAPGREASVEAEPDGDEEGVHAAREILRSQARLLETVDPEVREGAVASARIVAARALRALGRDEEAASVERESDGAGLAQRIGDALRGTEAHQPAEEPPSAPSRTVPAAGGGPGSAASAEPRRLKHLKVDQERIDALMDLVGELVVAKNSLPFLARRAEQEFGVRDLSRQIKAQYGVINRIAEDLQWAVMRVRMVPVSHVFQRFPRLVRDLSRKLGKRIRLVMEGEDTEADKNVVEDLAEPLVHLIRNAVDHGIEPPEERQARGKPAEGTIRLRAVQRDDQVVIEVADDGRGIDPEGIKRKAYERGLIEEERLEGLTEREALHLIFLPGFSTAEEVSDVSGRGVGMDVVRAMVERAGGTVTLESRKGMGTTVRLSLPLSMAVTRVMMVDAAGETFGIPMENVIETVRVPASAVKTIQGAEAVVWRERVLPLYRLAGVLGLNGSRPARGGNGAEVEEAVLVASVGGELLGLVVDRFHEGVDVLLKPLEGIMAGFRMYAGTAILGDGRVLLVLDLKELMGCL